MNKFVVHCMKEKFDIYCGRWNPKQPFQSKWANPFKVGKDGTREEVLEKFKSYLLNNDDLLLDLHELKDKVLGCWCSPLTCHCDILAELANNID